MINMTFIVDHSWGHKSAAEVLRKVWGGAKWPPVTDFHALWPEEFISI
jgi:hypothetical protein